MPRFSFSLLLALLLMFGMEILLWNDPLARAAGDWTVLLIGYVVLAVIVLDLIMRYRVSDIWGMMFVMGIYALLNGMLLNPAHGLEDVPASLVTRILGGSWLLGLEMIGFFFVLLHGRTRQIRRILIMGATAVGFNWGVWLAWYSVFNDGLTPFTVTDVLIYTLIPMVIVVGLFAYVRRLTTLKPQDFLLSLREWGILTLVMVGLAAVNVSRNSYNLDDVILIAFLIGLCGMGLWFRKDTFRPNMLERHLPMQPLTWTWLSIAVAFFAIMAMLAIPLPLADLFGLNQFSLITLAFAGVGIGWLPLVALVLSFRALGKYNA